MSDDRKIDFQKGKVYKWEDQVFLSSATPLPSYETQLLIIEACRGLGVSCPHVLHSERHPEALGPLSQNSKRDRFAYLVLHELAHYLNKDDDGHGPSFVRVYVELLLRFLPKKNGPMALHIIPLLDSLALSGICCRLSLPPIGPAQNFRIPSPEEL